MPLVIISGYPCAGKTRRAQQLAAYFESRIPAAPAASAEAPRSVVLIDDQNLGVAREAYAAAGPEKEARAAHASAIRRAIGQRVVVIADGLHYIKGFRYQLYCEAKAARTPSCVVHVGTPIPTCRAINDALLAGQTPTPATLASAGGLDGPSKSAGPDLVKEGPTHDKEGNSHDDEEGAFHKCEEGDSHKNKEGASRDGGGGAPHNVAGPSDATEGGGGGGGYDDDDGNAGEERGGYEPELFENLIYRYEEPDGRSRWDSPLFTVLPDDADPPYEAIWRALIGHGDGGEGGSEAAGATGALKTVKPNQATVLAPATDPNALYTLDRTTSAIASAITSYLSDHAGEAGGSVRMPEAEEEVRLPAGGRPVTVAQVQRLRREFVGLWRGHGTAIRADRAGEGFVRFLNARWGDGEGEDG